MIFLNQARPLRWLPDLPSDLWGFLVESSSSASGTQVVVESQRRRSLAQSGRRLCSFVPMHVLIVRIDEVDARGAEDQGG